MFNLLDDKRYAEIKNTLDTLEFSDVDPRIELNSAKQTETLGKANTLSAALFGAYLLRYKFPSIEHTPKLLFISYDILPTHKDYYSGVESQIFAAATYGSTNGFRGMGKSDKGFLVHCDEPHTKNELANIYASSISTKGCTPRSWSWLYLNQIFNEVHNKNSDYDWINEKENISRLTNAYINVHRIMSNSLALISQLSHKDRSE